LTEESESSAGGLSATLGEVDEMERFNFVGVTTTKSAIMRVFPVWAAHLELNGVTMSGHDLPLHAAPERYRELVAGIGSRSADLGALVTSHKIDLFKACSDMFDYIDPYASLCGEVSCLSKRDGAFRAHAKDPIASGRSLDEFLPQGHWSKTQAQALLFGAGGSNLAISLHLMTVRKPEDRPSRIIVVNRSPERLNSLRDLHEQLISNVEVEYVQNADSRENDRILAEVAAGSLVVNGTGMGKDSPGSPITDEATFPEGAIVWELNYRGELDFLHQARRQEHARGLIVEDGWRYFLRGWTSAMEEVFDIEITQVDLETLASLALPLRDGTR
jgi:shikimate 5-dehydrogenase